MTADYVAIYSNTRGRDEELRRAAALLKKSALSTVFESGQLHVLANQKYETSLLPDKSGIVIGDIYCRSFPSKAFDGTAEAASTILTALREGRLIDDYWGSYIAFDVPDGGEHVCIRSPFGNVNAYALESNGLVYLGSDAATILMLAGRQRSIDWEALAKHVIWDDFSHERTCIDGVEELRCGESAALNRLAESRTYNWSPWQFTALSRAIKDRSEAVDLIRREILRCVGNRIQKGRAYAVDLSGGLDSSIIAAAAMIQGRDISAITMYFANTEGDERDFARSVANLHRIPLSEISPDPEKLDIRRPAKLNLPRPHGRSFVQETDRLSLELAASRSIFAFVNGQGGDAVFCHLQSSAPAVDALRSRGAGPGFIGSAFELARAAQCNVWEVVQKSLAKMIRGKPINHWDGDTSFIARDARKLKLDGSAPWPSANYHPLPGKVEQVHGLYNSCYNMNGYRRSDTLEGVFPLLSQPLVEACLRVPSWMWIGHGRNRLIARQAMEPELPPKVAWRISKGGLGELQRRLLRRQRLIAREMLMDGLLGRNGIIDRDLIDAELKSDLSYQHTQIVRLLRLCDVEAWCSGTP